MNTLRVEREGALAVLRLDKKRGNSIDEPMVEDLVEACRALEEDEAVRGVLLASACPRLFCPGLDLIGLLDYDRSAMERFMKKFSEAVWSLYGLRKPVVAAINGHAIAGGCVFALTADYRVLRRGGFNIGLNEVRVGLPLPWTVAMLLRSSVGPERIGEVALLGRNFADEEARDVGLVHELAAGEELERVCLARLSEFAEKDAAALGATKRYLRAETLEAMRASEVGLLKEWLDVWFSDATRARIRATVESLGKSKA